VWHPFHREGFNASGGRLMGDGPTAQEMQELATQMSLREQKGKWHERYRRGSKSFAASLKGRHMNRGALMAERERSSVVPVCQTEEGPQSRHSFQIRIGFGVVQRVSTCHNFHRRPSFR
jgi:hypothetical protein